MGKYDFAVGMCSYGDVTDGTVMCLQRLHEETAYHFKLILRSNDALIGRSRSFVATEFLQGNYSDCLIFIDTDIVFTPEDVSKLVEAIKGGYDVIGGGVPMADGKRLSLSTFEGIVIPDGTIKEVEFLATGFLAISRRAFETVRDKLSLPELHHDTGKSCYPFFESGRDWSGRHNYYISEDWDFCYKTQDAGMKTYWHTGVLVGHLKRVMLSPERE